MTNQSVAFTGSVP